MYNKISMFLCLLMATCHLLAKSHSSSAVSKQEMHLLVLCDTRSAQTGRSHNADCKRIEKNIKQIAKQCRFRPVIHVLRNEQISLDNIEKWALQIKKFSTAPLFVYYTGTKEMMATGEQKWPAISIKEKGQKRLLSVYDIYKKVESLTMSLKCFFFADCYNDMQHISYEYMDFKHMIQKGRKMKGLPYLFCKPQGSLIACSAEQNGVAYGIDQKGKTGGLFTLMLCDALARVTTKPAFWQSVLAEVEAKCLYFAPDARHSNKAVKQQILCGFEGLVHPDISLAID